MSTFDLTRPADSSESEDDEDYVPSGEESEGDLTDCENDAESDVEVATSKKGKKGKAAGKRRGGMKLDASACEAGPPEDRAAEDPSGLTRAEKEKADLLWADFLKDVEPLPKKQPPPAVAQSCPTTSKFEPATVEKKVKFTKIMNFAGETVLVDTEVDTEEARERGSGAEAPLPGTKRPAGVQNVLSRILNKKQKLSVLDKSKLDWEKYKKEKGIEEEIQTHNRGKDGYLEKQAFLQRADLRQFEIEKNLRAKTRVNRLV